MLYMSALLCYKLGMIWIVVAIFVVGYLIVSAIDRNSANNALLAKQQYLESADYKKQRSVSLAYFDYVRFILDLRIWIAENKIAMFESSDRTATKMLKYKIQEHEKRIDGFTKEIQQLKNRYPDIQPESMEEIRIKYELDTPFPMDVDYENVTGESIWSNYEENNRKLLELNRQLSALEQARSHHKAH